MPTLKRRTMLRNFLQNQLIISMKKGTSSDELSFVEPLLRLAVEQLVALDYGEAQGMFAPGKKQTHDGTKPYTLRKLRMKALGFADLLIDKKYHKIAKEYYKEEDPPIRMVANAFGEKADTFRGWRKSPFLGKTRDKRMISFRDEIRKADWDKDRALTELNKIGAQYQREKELAFPKKVKGK